MQGKTSSGKIPCTQQAACSGLNLLLPEPNQKGINRNKSRTTPKKPNSNRPRKWTREPQELQEEGPTKPLKVLALPSSCFSFGSWLMLWGGRQTEIASHPSRSPSAILTKTVLATAATPAFAIMPLPHFDRILPAFLLTPHIQLLMRWHHAGAWRV